jgi:hypothetical protein
VNITGLSLDQFMQCAISVSTRKYAGNLLIHQDAHDRPRSKNGTSNCTARLTTVTSHGAGIRTAANGRRGKYACWHAYRDVLAEVFRRYPDAVIRAGSSWRVTYRGQDGFNAAYPETARKLVGSAASPVTMPELCDCHPEYADGQAELAWLARREQERAERTARTMAVAAPAAVATAGGTNRIRRLSERIATAAGEPPLSRADFEDEQARRADPELQPRRYPGYVPDPLLLEAESNPGYVSPAVARASRQFAASAELLGEGDKPADPLVFGPEYSPQSDPHSYRYAPERRFP